ncbi:MAG: DUF3108 domain-containing protein [Nitrospinae bacterium]|nr:DUF3108 domain-containing protein [Nitrospinota bacterium]MBF0293228.1 DUF3108 domain-containing protein [Nitrospinota bacterium]MBF0634072.1 DUF3108 domain-containing protein [Nitrospinota bacterium]
MPTTTNAVIALTTDNRVAAMIARAALSFVLAFFSVSPPHAVAGSGAKPLPFKAGERFAYDITWMGILGGEAVLGVRNDAAPGGPAALTVYLDAKSVGWVHTLYTVDDRSLSFFDTAGLYSSGVDIRISENSYTKRKRIDFDHGRGVAIYRVDNDAPKEYPIDPGTLDAFSVMYAYRAARERVRVGEELSFPIFDDRKKYMLKIRALRKERILVKGGYVDTIVAEPALMSEGIFQRRGKMTIWFSDDEAFAPVMMKSKVVFGSFWATLREWSGAEIKIIPVEPEKDKTASAVEGSVK